MAHRSHSIGRPTKIFLGTMTSLGFFLVMWSFLPWWYALLATVGAVLLFLAAEHINWSAIDWSRIWE